MVIWEAIKSLFAREPEYPYIEYPNVSDAEAIRREWEAKGQQGARLTLRQRAALRKFGA